MRVGFFVLSPRHVIGAVLAAVDIANALHRFGHEVHLGIAGSDPASGPITSLEEVPWIRPDPGVQVRFAGTPAPAERPEFGIGIALPGSLPLFYCHGVDQRVQFDHEFPVVCVSRWLVEHAREAGVPEHRLVYAPHGLAHETFRVTRPIADREVQVAMLHHSAPAKRTDDGLRALVALRERHPELRVVLFGTHEPRSRLPPGMRFVPTPTPEVLVDDVYNGSRIFLCPSEREGFGRPSLEAMASGCALVTVDNGGSREFATDGTTALVTAAPDVDAMVAALDALLRDDDRRIALAERGVLESFRFDWRVHAAQLDRFLRWYRDAPDRYVGDPEAVVPFLPDRSGPH